MADNETVAALAFGRDDIAEHIDEVFGEDHPRRDEILETAIEMMGEEYYAELAGMKLEPFFRRLVEDADERLRHNGDASL